MCALIVPRAGVTGMEPFHDRGGFVDYVDRIGGLTVTLTENEAGNKLGAIIKYLRDRYLIAYKRVKTDSNKRRRVSVKVHREIEKREGKLVITARVAYVEPQQ